MKPIGLRSLPNNVWEVTLEYRVSKWFFWSETKTVDYRTVGHTGGRFYSWARVPDGEYAWDNLSFQLNNYVQLNTISSAEVAKLKYQKAKELQAIAEVDVKACREARYAKTTAEVSFVCPRCKQLAPRLASASFDSDERICESCWNADKAASLN